MKIRLLALILCFTTLLGMLTACSGGDDEEVGSTIPVYLNSRIVNFDPARAYTDDSASQVLGLLYEGLTKLDAKGKVQSAMAKEWTYTANAEKNYYMVQFELNETSWSDGRQVSADDFVFAWKRIMAPDFRSEAAALLYDIKNAQQVKTGDLSIDDLGVTAADKTVLQVEFSHDIDLNAFLELCASPFLVPLREDKVSRDEDWGSNTALLVSNGPFCVRTNDNSNEQKLVLERNLYYFRDKDKDKIMKSVTPYRLEIIYGNDEQAHLDAYNNDEEVLNNNIALSSRNDVSKVKTEDTLITHTYFFNTTRAPFDNADVRRALSMALDRNAIADILVYAKAATGFVNSRIYETKRGTSFRSEGGDLISASADLEAAKSLIAGANVTTKSFTLTIRPNETDRAVAEYCCAVWKELGFNVTIKETKVSYRLSELEYDLLIDEFTELYRAGDFDMIAVDWTATSNYAWGVLAPFALHFSGGNIDIKSQDFAEVPHITGYNSEAYNALIDAAYAETDSTEKNKILHQAEQTLANDMPVMPLVELQNAYVIDSDLKKVSVNFYGYFNFTKANLRHAGDYAANQTEVEE